MGEILRSVIPQIATMARAGPDCSQEPGDSSRSPTRVTGAQLVEPSLAASQGVN